MDKGGGEHDDTYEGRGGAASWVRRRLPPKIVRHDEIDYDLKKLKETTKILDWDQQQQNPKCKNLTRMQQFNNIIT